MTCGLAIDGDPQSGWSGQPGRSHEAVFTLAQPLAAKDTLTVELLFEKDMPPAWADFPPLGNR